jgi:flagellar biosynthesis protein FlhF
MIIRTFTAPTVAAALKMIREEMGGDAIVLKTRICPEGEAVLTGNRVEVTACIDEKAVDAGKLKVKGITGNKAKAPAVRRYEGADISHVIHSDNKADADSLIRIEKTLSSILNLHRSPEIFKDVDSRLKNVFFSLLDADVPVEIAYRVSSDMADNIGLNDDVDSRAIEILKNEIASITVAGVGIQPGMKVTFAGPSGGGKSSVMAKVATQLSTRLRQKVRLASLDSAKISGFEELVEHSELIELADGISTETPGLPENDAVTLIDTPSIPRHPEEQSSLLKKLNAVNPDILFLVFSACARSRDLIDAIHVFESLSPSYLIVTHLDETERWGGMLAIAEYLHAPLAFVTDTPGGIGQLKTADPFRIAGRLLGREDYDSDA